MVDPTLIDASAKSLAPMGAWLWKNKDWVLRKMNSLREWFLQSEKGKILFIGPGGVGKTTLAKILSGEYDYLHPSLGEYEESIDIERVQLKDDNKVGIIVPPGQKLRRESTWESIQAEIANNEYRGIVQFGAFGYHSFGNISYKQDGLYDSEKHAALDHFVSDYTKIRRKDELEILKNLQPFLLTASRKLWLVTLITKQDLWYEQRIEVEKHYIDQTFGKVAAKIVERKGSQLFRHETVFASLVIRNFQTGFNECLQSNTAGYDQPLQMASMRRLIEIIDSLRGWEERK